MSATTRSSIDLDEMEARRRVVVAQRVQHGLGLVDYLGHSSLRVAEDRFVIKPKFSRSVRALDSLDAEDLLVMDLDGNVVEGAARPPAELWIHASIYRRRDDVRSVVHTHQPDSTLMGVLEEPVLPLLHVQSLVARRPVPIWRCPALVTDAQLGSELADALGDAPIAHMQGHGIVSVASSVEEATLQAIHLEQLSSAMLKILQTGLTPHVIAESHIQRLEQQLGPYDARWAYYCQVVDTQPVDG